VTGTLSPSTAEFRPLLKWPGGKRREWDEIEPHLPRGVRHFVDPFMGGLAPFAGTRFTGGAWLNDRHERLVALHRFVQAKDERFLGALAALADAWDALGPAAAAAAAAFCPLVESHRRGRGRPGNPAIRHSEPRRAPESLACALADGPARPAADAIAASVLDKAARLARLETRHGVHFGPADLAVHCETAVRAGFYTFVREREGRAKGASPPATADFLFLREYCYGSMFRHNAEGAFNIPYGGISYNGKSLRQRVEQYRGAETVAALGRATFSCGDFEPFLEALLRRLGAGDFVFADPPYDSDFRSYGPTAFGPADHVRLAAALARLPCRWMLVIKETEFVRATYVSAAMRRRGGLGPAREVHAFGKQYGYNVRGRNDRAARHLVVTNYV
jgi:DNA adenine methylase